GMRLPDGPIYATRLCGSGDDVLHRQYHVRRIPRETVRSTPAAQTSSVGRSSRKKNRPWILRPLGPRQSKTVVLNCRGNSGPDHLIPYFPSKKSCTRKEGIRWSGPELPLQLCTDSPSSLANTIRSSWIGSLPARGAR